LVGLAGISFVSRRQRSQSRHALDGGRPEKFKMDFYQPGVRGSAPQYGNGKFAVNSRTHWRTLNAMSNPIFQNLCFIRAGSVA
jgi:hypothetical protein